MSNFENGGPAFPRTGIGNAGVQYDVPPQDGMTLLDYLAAKAMVALLSRSDLSFVFQLEDDDEYGNEYQPEFNEWHEDGAGEHGADILAAMSYRVAYAMLAARKNVPQ